MLCDYERFSQVESRGNMDFACSFVLLTLQCYSFWSQRAFFPFLFLSFFFFFCKGKVVMISGIRISTDMRIVPDSVAMLE